MPYKDPEKERARLRAYRLAHPERCKAAIAKWSARNPEALRAIYREMARRKRARPDYSIRNRVLCGIHRCLNGQRKQAPLETLLGYTLKELLTHLERQFLPGMTWENRPLWHIDHIVPVVAFDLSDESGEGIRRAWALPNLRPVWKSDNLQKSSRREFLL
jgi:hypothetical protein